MTWNLRPCPPQKTKLAQCNVEYIRRVGVLMRDASLVAFELVVDVSCNPDDAQWALSSQDLRAIEHGEREEKLRAPLKIQTRMPLSLDASSTQHN